MDHQAAQDFQKNSRPRLVRGTMVTLELRPHESPAERRPAADLLPEVYAELRRLAAAMSDRLPPGQTLQPTALVHEAYLRLVRTKDPGWDGRRHFFGAAARAMREILIERARRLAAVKHGAAFERVSLDGALAVIEPPAEDVLALDEAIEKLEATKPHLAEIVMLRFYAGLSIDDTAGAVGRSASTVKREWRFARAWLARELGDGRCGPPLCDASELADG
jgi:RNA polymerase sigma factor (TIGR02999 family)